jgi:hypothetical protein
VFHAGFPFRLTPETLLTALATAVPREEALRLMKAGGFDVGSADIGSAGTL